MTTFWQDWGFWGFVATIVFGLWAPWDRLPYHQGELEKDSKYREEIVARLSDANLGESYRKSLARALGWLDQTFGEPGSFSALGVCVWVAVAYAYATFFIGWGLGGPGDIAGFDFMALCKPRMVYKINRGHGLQILPFSMPMARGAEFKGPFMEDSQGMKAVEHLPDVLVVIAWDEAHRFAD